MRVRNTPKKSVPQALRFRPSVTHTAGIPLVPFSALFWMLMTLAITYRAALRRHHLAIFTTSHN